MCCLHCPYLRSHTQDGDSREEEVRQHLEGQSQISVLKFQTGWETNSCRKDLVLTTLMNTTSPSAHKQHQKDWACLQPHARPDQIWHPSSYAYLQLG